MVRDYSAFLLGAKPTQRTPTVLEGLGWGPVFARQIDIEALTATRTGHGPSSAFAPSAALAHSLAGLAVPVHVRSIFESRCDITPLMTRTNLTKRDQVIEMCGLGYRCERWTYIFQLRRTGCVLWPASFVEGSSILVPTPPQSALVREQATDACRLAVSR